MFKKFLNKLTGDDSPSVPEINRLTIGRAAMIDDLTLKLIPQESVMEFPSSTYSIVAQGKADMGEGVHSKVSQKAFMYSFMAESTDFVTG